jgi:hypothetical protein
MEKIFGTAEMPVWGGTQTAEQINGVFKNARGYEKGIQKILGITNYYPVSQADDGSISVALFGDMINIRAFSKPTQPSQNCRYQQ